MICDEYSLRRYRLYKATQRLSIVTSRPSLRAVNLNAEKRELMNNADDFISISRHTERRFEDFIESWLDGKDPKFFVKVGTSGFVMATGSQRSIAQMAANMRIALPHECRGAKQD